MTDAAKGLFDWDGDPLDVDEDLHAGMLISLDGEPYLVREVQKLTFAIYASPGDARHRIRLVRSQLTTGYHDDPLGKLCMADATEYGGKLLADFEKMKRDLAEALGTIAALERRLSIR